MNSEGEEISLLGALLIFISVDSEQGFIELLFYGQSVTKRLHFKSFCICL